MNDIILIAFIYFVVVYFLVFGTYVLFINRRRKTYENAKNQLEVVYIVKKFGLDMKVSSYNDLKWGLAFINSFIISFTFVVIISIESFLLSLVLGFVIMIMLIYSCYELLGRFLKRREGKKYV